MTERKLQRLYLLKRLTYEAHEGVLCMLCERRTTRQQRRAILAVERAMRYLGGFEPEVARWERD
jgi:hypothetical protein